MEKGGACLGRVRGEIGITTKMILMEMIMGDEHSEGNDSGNNTN